MIEAPTSGETFRGIFFIVVAIALFDVMAVFVRILQPAFTPQELSAYRNVLGVIPSLALLIWTRELRFRKSALMIRQWPLALLRGVVVAVAQLAFYTSLGLLELATVATLSQTIAFFIVIFSIVILGERVGRWRWTAVVMGFLGAVLILRPGADTFSAAALLPVIGAACYGLSMVMIRLIDRNVSNALLYLYASTASAIGAITIVLLTTGFSPIPGLREFGLILAMALCGGVAVLLMMLAYRLTMPSVLAPFSFVSLLTSYSFGYFLFGEAPYDRLFPGIFLIVCAASLIMWREEARRRRNNGVN